MGVWQRGLRPPHRSGTGPCGGRSLFVGERFGERSTTLRTGLAPLAEPTYRVVRCPCCCPRKLGDRDRYEEVPVKPCTDVQGSCNDLAWNSKVRAGQGRGMLSPAFMKPRDAYDLGAEEAAACLRRYTEA